MVAENGSVKTFNALRQFLIMLFSFQLGDSLQFQLDKLYLPDTPDINQRLGPVDENVELCQFEEKVCRREYFKIQLNTKVKSHLIKKT